MNGADRITLRVSHEKGLLDVCQTGADAMSLLGGATEMWGLSLKPIAMTPRDPYRDERASLVAENERLRAALDTARSTTRSKRLFLVMVGVLAALHVVGLSRAPDLLNTARDGSFATGAAIVVALLLLDVAFGIWWSSKKGSP